MGSAVDRSAGEAERRRAELFRDRAVETGGERRAGPIAGGDHRVTTRARVPGDQSRRRRRRDAVREDHFRSGDLRAAVHDARRGHRRAAHRVRERVQPARRARVAAPARGRRAHGARRRTLAGRAAAPDRSARARRHRRGHRHRPERLRHEVVYAGALRQSAAILGLVRAGLPGDAVRDRG